jgi:hypothetical protein
MYKQSILLKRHNKSKKRHNGLQCPPCFIEDNRHLRIYKSTRALTCHLRTAHKLNHEELNRIKTIYSEYSEGSFIELCFKRGLLY